MKSLQIGMIAHAINMAYCQSLGDNSIPAWDDAPEQQRNSILAGVEMHIANPDTTPEESHQAWYDSKLADGWVYGETKDVEAKVHPCMLPYDQLPPEQKAKDFLFRGAVHALKGVVTQEELPPVTSQPDESIGAALPKVAQPFIPQGHIPVTYIGRREEFVDGLYGSTLSFDRGQTRILPGDLARKFLQHQDLFERAEIAEPIADDTDDQLNRGKEDEAEKNDRLEQVQDLFDQIDQMGKNALQHFALTKYRQELNSRLNLAEMRSQVRNWIDQFGAP